MPLGYKYAERDVDSFVDWSAVGKNLSDALSKEAQDRRDKIQAFEDQNLKDIDFLNRAPQGKYDPANKFTNNFAHDVKEQNAINYKLLRSGELDPRQFTLNRQNMMNGTNQLFDLQKTYQEEFDKRMAGIQSGDLQALNIANMEYVEMFGDFSKSKGIINPLDGTVNIGIMALNPKTGVMELTKDVMPVSVAMGKLRTEIKTFKVDDEINNSIKAFGDRKDAIYAAATTAGAGTITELTGVGALEKYPQFKNAITEFNKAVDGTIAGYFSGNAYNVSSVLTENTGKYNAKSYVYDKDIAAKDKTKLLLKIDSSTGLPVLDESAPHYAEQKKEAEDWVRTQIMSRLDSERKISTTTQSSQLREKPEWMYKREDEKKAGINMAEQLSYLVKGTPQQLTSSLRYFNNIPGVRVDKTDKAIVVQKFNDKGEKVGEIPYYLDEAGQPMKPLELAKSLISAFNKDNIREDYITDALPTFIKPKDVTNKKTTGRGYAATRDTPKAFADKVLKSEKPFGFDYNVFVDKQNVKEAMPILQEQLGKIPGLKITPDKTIGFNGVTFQIKGAPVLKLNTNEGEGMAKTHYASLMKYLNDNLSVDVKAQILGPDLEEQNLRAAEEKKPNYSTK